VIGEKKRKIREGGWEGGIPMEVADAVVGIGDGEKEGEKGMRRREGGRRRRRHNRSVCYEPIQFNVDQLG